MGQNCVSVPNIWVIVQLGLDAMYWENQVYDYCKIEIAMFYPYYFMGQYYIGYIQGIICSTPKSMPLNMIMLITKNVSMELV